MNSLAKQLGPAILLSASVSSMIFLPLPVPFKWLMFAFLLGTAATICLRLLSAATSSVALSIPVGFAAFDLAPLGLGSYPFLSIFSAFLVLSILGVMSLFYKSRVPAAVGPSGPDEVPVHKPKRSLPTTGEVLMSRQKAKKAGLPSPQFVETSWESDFRSISGMDEFKKKLRAAAFECAGPEDRNGILLHGEPGNGKTVFAKALAGELGLEFITIHQKKMKWIGEETINLFNQLNEAVSRAPCVIFIDEAESVLGARSDASRSSHLTETNSIVNRLLQFFVKYRTSGVVFVAATNFLDSIDPAIRRPGRFDFVFEVPNPDLAAREGLLRVGIKRAGSEVSVPDAVVKSLAKRWNGFNTATILAIPAQIPQYVKDTGKSLLNFDDFMAMLRRQQGIANKVAESTKSLTDMSYQPEQAAAIKNLISRMDRAFEIEEAGGDAPSGALFYGDPGTGKTETARMIAKETKWAFFPVTGSDIVSDPDLIDKTLKKVRNARPAIIFIDEADDLLGDRSTSPYKMATNKLLAAMDGADGRLSDLLWIASTNFAEASDAAVVRSGRFTEKIKFFKPADDALLKFAKEFLMDPRRKAVMSASWEEVAEVLRGVSIADAGGILMQAWNLTLTANGTVDRSNPFTLDTLLKARRMVSIQ